jgi:hypothetical protein
MPRSLHTGQKTKNLVRQSLSVDHSARFCICFELIFNANHKKTILKRSACMAGSGEPEQAGREYLRVVGVHGSPLPGTRPGMNLLVRELEIVAAYTEVSVKS